MVAARVTKEGFMWITQRMPFNWKFELDGVDRTTHVITAEVTKSATWSIGHFKLQMNNNAGTYDTFSGGETFKFYADLSDASTKVFEGVVEKVEKKLGDESYIMVLEGSHLAYPLIDTHVTKSYENTYVSEILKNLIDSYLTDFTYTNVDDVETATTVNWSNKPLLDCVIDLCKIGGCDFYVDDDRDFHFFKSGSKLSTTEAVTGTRTGNLVEFEMFGTNIGEVKNKIIVCGEDENGQLIVATAEDTTSQTDYGTKELIIKDTDISTYDEALDRADAELLLQKTLETKGMTTSFWLLTLNPGEKMWISIPDRQVHDKYIISKLTHKFPDLFTECTIYKEHLNLVQLFKRNIEKSLQNQIIVNPHEMEHSYNFTFDNDTNLAHANTQTVDGSLVLVSGTTGTCTSAKRDAGSNITQVHLKIAGQDYGASTFEVSVDNGTTWEEVIVNELYTVTSSGKRLKWRIVLTSDTDNPYPKIDSLALLYK